MNLKGMCITAVWVKSLILLAFAVLFLGCGVVYGNEVLSPPAAAPVPASIEIAEGPFEPTWESLRNYECPDWFRDAKLGFWAILTPQSLAEAGDWYARAMYVQGSRQYNFHVENYGHPSKFGYKDLVQLWKVENWDPEELMKLYKQAGARYFVVLANHHENWDNWDSTYHRWNSVNVGPQKDIVGLWAKAARKHGLRFGVTEHVARSYSWWNTNKGSDREGPLAGVPYDGNDPRFEDLYFPPHDDSSYALPSNPPEWWPRQWFWRIRDLIDTYQPDLLYTDNAVPFGEVGRSLIAHYYNANMGWTDGRLEAVYNLKDYGRADMGEYMDGIGVEDVERGGLADIKDEPWQTDTCIGDWFYKKNQSYKTPIEVIGLLCDVVSKNGNLLLNIPLKPDGTLDAEAEDLLAELGAWMAVNGEAIYGTRPWKVYGEGRPMGGGHIDEDARRYSDRDIRFTTKDGVLYALILGWPEESVALVRTLGSGAGIISHVDLLGYSGTLYWVQTDRGLEVVLPSERPSDHAFALKITGEELQPVPVAPELARYDAHGRLFLEARDAQLHGDTPIYQWWPRGTDHIGYWHNPEDSVSWTFDVFEPGHYDVAVSYSCAPDAAGSEFVLELGDQALTGKSVSTGSWTTYVTRPLGQLVLSEKGSHSLRVKPRAASTWKSPGLQSVVLTPADRVSKAHQRSAFAVLDPSYNAVQLSPQPDRVAGAPWLYGSTELESWQHQQMRVSSKAVAQHGSYPGVFHEPFTTVSFRRDLPPEVEPSMEIAFKASGDVRVTVEGVVVYQGQAHERWRRFTLPETVNHGDFLQFDLSTSDEPPALLIAEGPLVTSSSRWQWRAKDVDWQRPAAFAQTRSGVIPHRKTLPEMVVEPAGRNSVLYDFGRQLIGYPVFESKSKPSIRVGESMTEALDTQTPLSNLEQVLTLVKLDENTWISKYPLAFRYLQVLGENPANVHCRAQFWPSRYRGAFACSDELLTRIWMTAAYSHRLNKYHFILDGIKRDRLPWVDNMKLSSAVEAYTFADPELLRRTLSVLGRATDQSPVNNIIDYNALWVISQEAYQRQFDDPSFLQQEWPRIRDLMAREALKCDTDGFLRWPEGSWVFIDWAHMPDKFLATQIMWYWAQRCTVRLAERVGDLATAEKWTRRADAFEQVLRKKAWSQEYSAWVNPDSEMQPARHSNLLSMVSGLSGPEHFEGVMAVLQGDKAAPVHSMSMHTHMVQTLVKRGKLDEALDTLRTVWGRMINDHDATTFWEGIDMHLTGSDAYQFYGRPYGKSLCHAWGAGPVFLLPEILFGLKPTEDGWRAIELKPTTGLLEWAYLTVPTRYGDILLEMQGDTVTLTVPAGITAVWDGHTIDGPMVLSNGGE